jgi:hypothetical protein
MTPVSAGRVEATRADRQQARLKDRASNDTTETTFATYASAHEPVDGSRRSSYSVLEVTVDRFDFEEVLETESRELATVPRLLVTTKRCIDGD